MFIGIGYVCAYADFWYNGSMAIKELGKTDHGGDADGRSFDVYNGEWEALQAVTRKWGLKDEVSALRFALAVLVIAKPGGLIINGDNMGPANSLLKDKDGERE